MDEIAKNIWAVLRKIETPYLVELNQFVDFLELEILSHQKYLFHKYLFHTEAT